MSEGVEVEYIDADELPQEEWTEMDKQMEIYASNGGYTNLRELPDTESESLEQLRNGDRVHVTAMTGLWSKCETENNVGYIMTQFLRDIQIQISDTVSIPRDLAQKLYEALGKAIK